VKLVSQKRKEKKRKGWNFALHCLRSWKQKTT